MEATCLTLGAQFWPPQTSYYEWKEFYQGGAMLQSAKGQFTSQRITGLDPAMANRLTAARAGDQHEFSGLTEPYRHELQLHCYRILGSLQDAEDTVQETLLRAWRRLDTFEGRASLRAWLYKIATNACFDALDKRPRRRVLPTAQFPPADPHQPFALPITEPIWLEPYPDDLIAEPETEPEARYSLHESVSLAFLAALQSLPPRQRAVLILCDVLDWEAGEAAELLDTTVSAVSSALHRARVTMNQRYHAHGRDAVTVSPLDADRQSLLDRYVQVWEAADIDGLVNLLREDATLSMPPLPTWYAGRGAIIAAAQTMIFAGEARGRWLMRSIRANRQPTCAVYQRDEAGAYRAFGISVLTVEQDQVTDIVTFIDPALFLRFNLPIEITA
jgi:RNA polymerase sigma-70 factor (ECF subfamily)